LFDPLFRVPFLTGLLLAGLLPLIGMYLRLRGEWLAALAFAQMASAGALLAMVLGWPMLAGGALAALLAALAKGLRRRRAPMPTR
jgi:zinc/manganese transport system permease protein